jgi:hypothetical protein
MVMVWHIQLNTLSQYEDATLIANHFCNQNQVWLNILYSNLIIPKKGFLSLPEKGSTEPKDRNRTYINIYLLL